MCTVKDERTVLVCDVAIGRVKEELGGTFDAGVRYTVVPGKGTLVEADGDVDAVRFTSLARAAIVEAQAIHGHAADRDAHRTARRPVRSVDGA